MQRLFTLLLRNVFAYVFCERAAQGIIVWGLGSGGGASSAQMLVLVELSTCSAAVSTCTLVLRHALLSCE